MPLRHFIWAVLLIMAAPVSAARQQPQAEPQPTTRTSRGYTVFVAGAVAGREDVTVETAADGILISGQGRLSGSRDVVVRRAEVRYGRDWTPTTYELEASVGSGEITVSTSFSNGAAVTKGFDEGGRIDQTDKVPPRVIVLPTVFFGAYEALTRRLVATTTDKEKEFPAFIGAMMQGTLRIVDANVEQMQVGTSTFNVRRYQLAFMSPRGVAVVHVFTDDSGSLLRVNIPAQRVDVIRDDLAAATARTIVYSNPTDEAVNIPATGFNLGATLTWPASAKNGGTAAKLPAVVLLAAAAANERDGVVGGVPILGQLAGAIADAGFVAVRFDKRGHGQSGGRAESATLGDQAEDALAVVRWLGNRREIDRDRIAVLGHNEGAWAALLVAAREGRIAGVVSIAAPSTTGLDRNLEQQRHTLDQMNLSPAERVAKIEEQKRIDAAVMSGRGWENFPADVRRQADTPWFQSFLTFDPARAIRDVRQPLLLVHGELDAEVPVSHLDRLGELAQKQSRSKMVNVVAIRGVNHLLTPAVTGDVSEYAALTNRNVSADVKRAITEWLVKATVASR
jgi:uncharacterized protein